MGLRDLLGGKGKQKKAKASSGQAKSNNSSSGSVMSPSPATVGASGASIVNDGLQEQIDAVSSGGVLTLDISRGEYGGPIVINHPITIDGQGRSIWSKKGPVVSVQTDGVTLSNLEIEVTGNEKKLSDDEACALAVKDGFQVALNDVVVRGNVAGVIEEEGIWRYPRSIHFGTVKASQPHEFMLRLAVPIPCRLKSEIAGLNVTPSSIRDSGVTDLTLKLDALSPGTRLRGSILMQTAFLTRRIMVGGTVARTPGRKAVEGTGQVLWEPEDAGSIPAPQAAAPVAAPQPVAPPAPSQPAAQQPTAQPTPPPSPASPSEPSQPIVIDTSPEPEVQPEPPKPSPQATPAAPKQKPNASKKIPAHPPVSPQRKKTPVVPDPQKSVFKQDESQTHSPVRLSTRTKGVPAGGVFGSVPAKPAKADSGEKESEVQKPIPVLTKSKPPDKEKTKDSKKTPEPAATHVKSAKEKAAGKVSNAKPLEKKPPSKKLSRVKTDGLGGAWGA